MNATVYVLACRIYRDMSRLYADDDVVEAAGLRDELESKSSDADEDMPGGHVLDTAHESSRPMDSDIAGPSSMPLGCAHPAVAQTARNDLVASTSAAQQTAAAAAALPGTGQECPVATSEALLADVQQAESRLADAFSSRADDVTADRVGACSASQQQLAGNDEDDGYTFLAETGSSLSLLDT